MQKKLNIAASLAAFLILAHLANAQNLPPLPPNVLVNGHLLSGSGGGSYSTNNYDSNGGSAGLTINSTGVFFGAQSSGYWSQPYIITFGYWVSGYYIPGYWIYNGYWTTGYWSDGSMYGGYPDDSGNWVSTGTWVDPVWMPENVWVPEVWVDANSWVDDVWSSPTWVQTAAWSDTGSYAHFAFQMANGTTVQPADEWGNPWATSPRSGIPAVQVNSTLYQFNASDTVSSYDYYSDPNSDGYLWITPGYYGGYDSQSNVNFAGSNSNGFLRDYSNTGVALVPRNSDGSFLSIGSPSYGPPQIWSNGITFQFLTTDTTNGLDVYLSSDGYAFVDSSGNVSGLLDGTYANAVFQGTTAATFPANTDGSPSPAGIQPRWGPPAIYLAADLWNYRGSTSTADYYGGPRPGQVLSIGSDGTVTYSDRTTGISNASGLYAGGAFQNLQVVVRGAGADGSAWTTLPANSGYPAAVTVNDSPWYYSSTLSGPGYATYLDPLSGQTLYVKGSDAVISNPTAGTYMTGSYANGKFTFANANVSAANPDGTPLSPVNPSNPQVIAGDLDVAGNFTLGSWTNAAGESVNGFALSFAARDQGSLLRFDATRFATDWLWTRILAPGATQPLDAMRLDSDNNLKLYTIDETPVPTIVLSPGGRSRFDGPVRIAPQGDLPMGEFTHEPQQ
jgi:hypothetical protein